MNTTTTWKQLSRPLRTAIAAPWCALLALCAVAATPGGQTLLLDYAHRPMTPVSLDSANWTGTLAAARLPVIPADIVSGLATVAYSGNGADLAETVPPILPADACAGYLPQFFDPTGNANISGSGITHVDQSLLTNYVQNCVWNYGVVPNFAATGCELDQNTVDGLLLTLAAYHASGAVIDISDGAYPTGETMHQDASVTLQLPAPIPANAGLVFSTTTGQGSGRLGVVVYYDATIPLSASAVADNYNVWTATIGVQDSPAMADVVTSINALYLTNTFVFFNGSDASVLQPDGSYVGTDAVDADYPVTCTGPAIISTAPGVALALPASVTTLQANGCTVLLPP